MPTHLDPAFLEPTPAPPVERDPDTIDLFELPADTAKPPSNPTPNDEESK